MYSLVTFLANFRVNDETESPDLRVARAEVPQFTLAVLGNSIVVLLYKCFVVRIVFIRAISC